MISWNRDRCTSGRPNAALTRSAAAVASSAVAGMKPACDPTSRRSEGVASCTSRTRAHSWRIARRRSSGVSVGHASCRFWPRTSSVTIQSWPSIVPTPRIFGCPTSGGSARTSATSAAMPSTTDVFAIRTARPLPTQVAFEIPRARRIPRRSPPCWATTWAARDRTTAAPVGSPCWSSQCVSASGSFIAGATSCEYPEPQLLLCPRPVAECLRTPRSPTLRRHAWVLR